MCITKFLTCLIYSSSVTSMAEIVEDKITPKQLVVGQCWECQANNCKPTTNVLLVYLL